MILKIPDFSLPPLPVTQTLKPAHRLTIIFGATVLVGAVVYFAVRSLRNRAHVPSQPVDPNKEIRTLYDKGLNHLKLNNTALAEADLNQALESYNTKLSDNFQQTNDPLLSGQIYYQLGVCYERKEDYNKALEKYDEALSLTKGRTIHAEISLKKGMLIQNKELENSIAIYDQVIAATDHKGKTPDLKLYTIACLLKSHALLRKELPTKGQSTEARKEALAYAKSAGTSAKGSKDFHFVTEALYQQALCNRLLGCYEKAMKKYAMALYLVENLYTRACILYDRALLRERNSFLSEAVKDYKAALECKFTDEHFLESSQFQGPFKKGAPSSFQNLEEFKATIKASTGRLAERGIV